MKSVVICGSKRFKAEIRDFASKLKTAGVVVYEPYLHKYTEQEWAELSAENKNYISLGLTYDHFQKIRQADTVYVYDKDGYIGNSTTLEMGFATALAKPIYAFESDREENCRNVLFREIIKTPTDLVKRLK